MLVHCFDFLKDKQASMVNYLENITFSLLNILVKKKTKALAYTTFDTIVIKTGTTAI